MDDRGGEDSKAIIVVVVVVVVVLVVSGWLLLEGGTVEDCRLGRKRVPLIGLLSFGETVLTSAAGGAESARNDPRKAADLSALMLLGRGRRFSFLKYQYSMVPILSTWALCNLSQRTLRKSSGNAECCHTTDRFSLWWVGATSFLPNYSTL